MTTQSSSTYEADHDLLLGAGIKSVDIGVVIDKKLDNQIFELSQLAPWKNQNLPIIIFIELTEFLLF